MVQGGGKGREGEKESSGPCVREPERDDDGDEQRRRDARARPPSAAVRPCRSRRRGAAAFLGANDGAEARGEAARPERDVVQGEGVLGPHCASAKSHSECTQEQGVREGRRERDARRGIASQVLPLKPASTLAVAIVSYHSGSHSA